MSSFDSSQNPRASATLAAYLSGGRLPHAILVEGHSGVLAFAKLIAKAAVCGSDSDKLCGACRDCVKADKGVHPDILIYSGGERARSFHIDTVRELRQEAYVKPNEADSKVFILENVQNMTVQAQNALLKIIEEPPRGVTFILTCENKAALLETVLSRVSVFSLDGADSADETGELAKKAKIVLDEMLAGSELTTLRMFAEYEKDRAMFAEFLKQLRAAAVGRMISNAKSERPARSEQIRLERLVMITDEAEQGLNQNVNGLLMTAIIPAKFKSRL